MTLEAYLDFELTSDVKHEFHDGKLYVAGEPRFPQSSVEASSRHNTITVNISGEIRNFIKEQKLGCFTQSSDQKVYVPALNKSLYPDGCVICDKLQHPISGRTDIILNPHIIIEVLSPSTGEYDRGDKFFFYQTIESFKEYVLIDQKQASVEVRYLVDKERNLWQYKNYRSLDEEVELQSIGCKIPMKEIYFMVEFDPPQEVEGEEVIVE